MTRLTLVGTPTVVAVSAADPTPDNSGFGELPGMIIGTRDFRQQRWEERTAPAAASCRTARPTGWHHDDFELK
jgi:hypothetical protein